MPTKKLPLLVKTVKLPDPPAPKVKQRKEKKSKKTHGRIQEDIRAAEQEITAGTRLSTGLVRRIQEAIANARGISRLANQWDRLSQSTKDGVRNQNRRLRRLIESIESGERERLRLRRGTRRYRPEPRLDPRSIARTLEEFETHIERSRRR